jgi:hypothetical protein
MANKRPRSRHEGNPAERNMDHPMHSKMYMIDSDPIESYTLTCKMPRSGKLPPTFNRRQRIMPPSLIINLQTGRLASGVSVVHHTPMNTVESLINLQILPRWPPSWENLEFISGFKVRYF